MTTKEPPSSESERDEIEPDGNLFDSFARRAGASLRSPAPEDGIGAVLRQGNRQRARRLAIEVGVVLAVVVGGVVVFNRSNRNERKIDIPPVPTQTTIPVPTSVASAAELSQWFLDYTGNPAGAASGEPVKFGVVMPSLTYGMRLDTAVTYLNEQAGGVGGRPIELDPCVEELSACADRFAADPALVAVLENRWTDDSIGAALAGRKPLHTTYSGDGTSGVGYYPTYRETVHAMALQAAKLTEPGERVLVLDAATDQATLQGSLKAFVTPDVTDSVAGREVVASRVSVSQPLADTIRALGATDVAAIVLATPPIEENYTLTVRGGLVCDVLFDALVELDISPAVIVDRCDPHEGWYQVDMGYDQTAPDLRSGALPISVNMAGLGAVKGVAASRSSREIGGLLAVIRLINELGGPVQATPAALDQAMREFTGPLPLGAGPLNCTPTGKVVERVQPGSCVRFVDVHQFVHDTWVELEPIDLSG
jgi:hypothetical protein